MGINMRNNMGNNIKKNDNTFFNNFNTFNILNEKWDNVFNFCIGYFIQFNYSENLIKIIKRIKSNKILFIGIFLFFSWYWSNILLTINYYFMLIDSIIISLLILQNNCINTNSRRLAKNVILLALTSFNLIGGVMTMLMIMFIYLEYSKFINRIIFKFLKFIIKIIGNMCPPVYLLYPDIKLFNFDDPDMTIVDNKKKYKNNKKSHDYRKYIDLDLKNKKSNSSSDSDNESELESESESSSETKSNSNSESNLNLNSKSLFPTISSFKRSKNKSKNNFNKSNKKSKKKFIFSESMSS